MSKSNTPVVAVGALLLGVLIGSFAGRSSTRSLEDELAQVRAELKESKEKSSNTGTVLAGVLRDTLQNRRLNEGSVSTEVEGASAGGGATPSASASPGTTPGVQLARTEPNSEERKQMLDTLAGTWRLRSTQAKASFLEAANLTDEQKAGFQAVTEQLNEAVKAVIKERMEDGALKNPPESRDMVELMVQMGEVYIDTDDHLKQVLTPEQLGIARDQGFEMMSQVDPEVMMPLLLQLEAPQRGPSGSDDADDGE